MEILRIFISNIIFDTMQRSIFISILPFEFRFVTHCTVSAIDAGLMQLVPSYIIQGRTEKHKYRPDITEFINYLSLNGYLMVI